MVTWSSWRCSLQRALKCRPWCSTGGSHSHVDPCGHTPIWGLSCTARWVKFAHHGAMAGGFRHCQVAGARLALHACLSTALSSRLAASRHQAGPACTVVHSSQQQASCLIPYGQREAGPACTGMTCRRSQGRLEQCWAKDLCKTQPSWAISCAQGGRASIALQRMRASIRSTTDASCRTLSSK